MVLCKMLTWNLTAAKKVFSSAADCDVLNVFYHLLKLEAGSKISVLQIIVTLYYYTQACTHTHTQQYTALCPGLHGMSWYEKNHSPTHTHPDHHGINILHQPFHTI